MAVFIKATYSKKLGLPQYSSHQYTVEVSSELTDVSQLSQASADLYARLQQAVDGQIVNPGFMPGDPVPSSGQGNGSGSTVVNGASAPAARGEDSWKCSDKQRDLILKIVDEHALDKAEIEKLAQERYGTGVKQLNKLQLARSLGKTIGSLQAHSRRRLVSPALRAGFRRFLNHSLHHETLQSRPSLRRRVR